MPPVVGALVAAGISAGVAYLTGAAIMAAFVTTFVLTLVSSLLTPKPKMPTLGNLNNAMQERTQMVRQPAHPRRIIYGTSKVSGTLLFIETANNNQDLYLILALASHEIDGVMIPAGTTTV